MLSINHHRYNVCLLLYAHEIYVEVSCYFVSRDDGQNFTRITKVVCEIMQSTSMGFLFFRLQDQEEPEYQ